MVCFTGTVDDDADNAAEDEDEDDVRSSVDSLPDDVCAFRVNAQARGLCAGSLLTAVDDAEDDDTDTDGLTVCAASLPLDFTLDFAVAAWS